MERECDWAVWQTAGQQKSAGDVWIASCCAAHVYTHALTQRNKNLKRGLGHSSYAENFIIFNQQFTIQFNTLSEKSAKTLPLEVQQPVTWGKPLQGHLCALSTHKRCILAPCYIPLNTYIIGINKDVLFRKVPYWQAVASLKVQLLHIFVRVYPKI